MHDLLKAVLEFKFDFVWSKVKGKAIPVQAMEAIRVVRVWGSHNVRHSARRWRQGCQPYVPAAF
jgi:hypothetical protein